VPQAHGIPSSRDRYFAGAPGRTGKFAISSRALPAGRSREPLIAVAAFDLHQPFAAKLGNRLSNP
jgi:hypothetical protein